MVKSSFDLPLLPPQIDYNKLVGSIAKANASVAKLDAVLAQLKNPKLLQRTLMTREAVLSSQIEGTEATLQEVLEQEAKGVSKEETPGEKDYREILNYRKALEKGVEILKDGPLTENVIKELHSILLNSVRGHNKGPGEFRRKLVYIGKPGASLEEATFVPPLPIRFPDLVSDLVHYINSKQDEILVQIGITHYQFEAIHPFEDGNGRIGRLLISLMLYQKELLTQPSIYLSEFFEEHRRDYYDLLLGVSERGEWEEWLSFFLKGIEIQAEKARVVSLRIIDLHDKLKSEVVQFHSRYAHEFLDGLFMNPYMTSRALKTRSKIKNSQTLFTLIQKFKDAKIIEDLTPHQRRNKFYKFTALEEILYS